MPNGGGVIEIGSNKPPGKRACESCRTKWLRMRSIAERRLRNQRVTGTRCKTPEEVVHLLGAVQCQDFAPGKWSLGQRTIDATDELVQQRYAEGAILRTHVLRPTWHFVLPADIRWMLELTAPRVHAANSGLYRSQELENATLTLCQATIEEALADARHLTRKEIGAALERAGVPTNPLRLASIVMNLELNAVLCSG